MTIAFNKTTQKQKRQFLRTHMPKAEIILWSRLRRKQVEGYKFRRQYSVGSYVIDFYSPQLKLAIEIDGETHFGETAEGYDRNRQEYIEHFGIQFLRFTNKNVYHNLNGVLQKIRDEIEVRKNKPPHR